MLNCNSNYILIVSTNNLDIYQIHERLSSIVRTDNYYKFTIIKECCIAITTDLSDNDIQAEISDILKMVAYKDEYVLCKTLN